MWAANLCLSPNIGGSGYSATYDYAACFDADVTGGTCAAVCKAGYTTGSGSTSISLVCGTDGAFDTPTLGDPLVCTANSCTDAVPISATTGLDYSSCVDGDVTGAMCVPICLAGYTASGSTSGFALTSADVLAEHVRQRRSHARAWLATYDYASCIDGYSCSTDSDLLSQIGSTPWTVNEYINRLVVVNPPFSSSKSTADLCRLECPFVGLMAMVDALNPTCPTLGRRG